MDKPPAEFLDLVVRARLGANAQNHRSKISQKQCLL
jgi:hypothetical protein